MIAVIAVELLQSVVRNPNVRRPPCLSPEIFLI
jgi:hypothetical protein